MKREEKNQQTRRRIMDSALAEFSQQGYGASSVNAICAAQGISKGIIYHYFKSKDALYLACVEECFQRLTDYMEKALQKEEAGSVEQRLGEYFAARMAFFQKNPVYQSIFCEAVMTPPGQLAAEIRERKQAFDTLTTDTLTGLLGSLTLRPDTTAEEVVELFRQFQDFINARYRPSGASTRESFALRDEYCRKLLEILLYGVLERKTK